MNKGRREEIRIGEKEKEDLGQREVRGEKDSQAKACNPRMISNHHYTCK
jgi:hypothetical protein